MFFFFQAEDGIRGSPVTGVQTCALPILPVVEVRARRAVPGWVQADGAEAAEVVRVVVVPEVAVVLLQAGAAPDAAADEVPNPFPDEDAVDLQIVV